MCKTCGHPLDQHYRWSAGDISGAECSLCLYVSKGKYTLTGKALSHTFVPPDGYSVSVVVEDKGGLKQVLALTASLGVAA